MKKSLKISLLLVVSFVFFLPLSQEAQILPGGKNVSHAKVMIDSLKEGILIVPLMKQNNKMKTLKELCENPDIDSSTRKKLQKKLEKEKKNLTEFNDALKKHFSSSFTFCQVRFVEDHELSTFNSVKTSFIETKSVELSDKDQPSRPGIFILRYQKSSGVAANPEEVRIFKIADSGFSILKRPFPDSPGRQATYKLRFLDLLNLSPDINDIIETLVVKLNASLFRYWNGKVD